MFGYLHIYSLCNNMIRPVSHITTIIMHEMMAPLEETTGLGIPVNGDRHLRFNTPLLPERRDHSCWRRRSAKAERRASGWLRRSASNAQEAQSAA
jgi:hypothetical protein